MESLGKSALLARSAVFLTCIILLYFSASLIAQSSTLYNLAEPDSSNLPLEFEYINSLDDTVTTSIADAERLYNLGFNGVLKIYDNTNPEDPVLLHWTIFPRARDLKLHNKLLYISDNDKKISIYDMSNPQAPNLLGAFTNIAAALDFEV